MNPNDHPIDVVVVDETADLLGIRPSSVIGLAESGLLRPSSLHPLRFSRSDIDSYIRQCERRHRDMDEFLRLGEDMERMMNPRMTA
ncbi:helix-turn-helix domain-containing protein [Bifidobacterium sp. SO1]|nr:helix-turn-helix domain-containing protein [Bifidobacterium sp. SO1]